MTLFMELDFQTKASFCKTLIVKNIIVLLDYLFCFLSQFSIVTIQYFETFILEAF
jgi:hypothetical protein